MGTAEHKKDPAIIVIGQRGFGAVRPNGERAYATVHQVHASAAAIAEAKPQRGTSFGTLQEAALRHASTLDDITGKLANGELDEAEAARRTMKLLGAPLHHAIDYALNKEQAQSKLARARRDSIGGKRKSLTLEGVAPPARLSKHSSE